jgi:hypothetical protein
MNRYNVELSGYANFSTTVEANSEDEALDLAYDSLPSSYLCARCSGWSSSWSLDLGESWDREDPIVRKLK